jgi:hypothetical protein
MATTLAKLELTDGKWQQVDAAVRFQTEEKARAEGERWVAEDPPRR